MIKINLLPAYVLEKHLARRTVIIVGLVLLGQLAALGFAVLKSNQAMAEENLRLEYWKKEAAKVSEAEQLNSQVVNNTVPYQQYVDFVANVHTHHRKWAWLYEEAAKWIDNKVVLNALNISGMNVQLQGATDSLESAKRWYLNTMRCYLYSSVQLSVSVPGWSPPLEPSGVSAVGAAPAAGMPGISDRESVPVSLACALKPEYVITPPAPPAAGGQIGVSVARPAMTVAPGGAPAISMRWSGERERASAGRAPSGELRIRSGRRRDREEE